MKNKYQKLMYKGEFLEMLSRKLSIKKETLQFYFTTGKVPVIHYKRIDEALDLQLSLDNKIKEMRINEYERL